MYINIYMVAPPKTYTPSVPLYDSATKMMNILVSKQALCLVIRYGHQTVLQSHSRISIARAWPTFMRSYFQQLSICLLYSVVDLG